MAATAAATTAGDAGPAAAPIAAGRSGNSVGFGDLPRWLAERLFEGAEDNAGGRPTQALVVNCIVYSAASYEPVMRCRLSRNLAGMLLTDAQQKAAAAAAAALLAAASAAADRAAGE
jgi:hypothetical protein